MFDFGEKETSFSFERPAPAVSRLSLLAYIAYSRFSLFCQKTDSDFSLIYCYRNVCLRKYFLLPIYVLEYRK